MDKKEAVCADAYEQKRLDWHQTVTSVHILLPELMPMVADYSTDVPEFRWYTRRNEGMYWLSCEYKETTIHVLQFGPPIRWGFMVIGDGQLKDMIFDQMKQLAQGFPYYHLAGWREVCALGETVAQHMNKYRNTHINYVTQAEPPLLVSVADDEPNFPFAKFSTR